MIEEAEITGCDAAAEFGAQHVRHDRRCLGLDAGSVSPSLYGDMRCSETDAACCDPLQRPGLATAPAELLSALIGALENGGAWVMNLRLVPHWLIVGATRSGKSTLLARLITQLAPQPVALVGIDCKGGMELGLFAGRLSALATSRREAVAVLGALALDMQERMSVCRSAGVRSIWELPDKLRPVPVVVIVDEIATRSPIGAGATSAPVILLVLPNLPPELRKISRKTGSSLARPCRNRGGAHELPEEEATSVW